MEQQKNAVTPERIMQMAWGYAPPLIIEAGLRHKVFDALDAGPKTVAEMAKATGASERGLKAVMNALVGLELLKKDGERYELTPESATFLVTTKPTFFGGMVAHTSGQLIPNWLHLTEVVKTGKPAAAVNTEGDGSAFFQELVSNIFPMSYGQAKALGEHMKFGESGGPVRVLDLGAGSGVWGIAVAQSSPRVTVTAVDWEGVLPVTKKTVAKFGLSDRYSFVAGDLLSADFGTGHNLATVGHILHSEGVERSKKLLRKIYDALAPGGTIAIAEFLVNSDRTGPPMGLIFAVNMLVNTDNGDTWSFEEIAAWLKEVGFKDARQVEAPGPSPLILATRP
ncbi:MAG TPA: methyltransferase [Acidobacteriaceae bacterium]|jgi:ubiquinone/menaquinone biosynthesis C-methylase UbiE|nr:methyltransferase [Acidobacteriaceae bacterium]